MRPEITNINGLCTGEELIYLQELCRGLPIGKILEIGTFNGQATAALCEAVGDARVVSVDDYHMKHHGENSLEFSKCNLQRLDMAPTLLAERSPLSAELLRLHCSKIALLFLDGHHHPKTVHEELHAYTPYVEPLGVVALHDYERSQYPGYTETIDEFFSTSQDWEHIGIVQSLVAFRKRASCPTPAS